MERGNVIASGRPGLPVKIGKCIAVRRDFCGLSKQQLGARVGSTQCQLRRTSKARSVSAAGFYLKPLARLKRRLDFAFGKMVYPRFVVLFAWTGSLSKRVYFMSDGCDGNSAERASFATARCPKDSGFSSRWKPIARQSAGCANQREWDHFRATSPQGIAVPSCFRTRCRP